MEYIVRTLLTLVTNGAAQVADFIGTGILELLTMDIGSGDSVFDIVFSSFIPISKTLEAVALVLLFMNYGWQLFRIMATPDGAESPLRLTVTTVAAGFGIALSRRIIYAFEALFNEIYKALLALNLNDVADGEWNFQALANNLSESWSTHADTAGGVVVDILDASPLGTMLIVLILILLLAYHFVIYLVEVVERYVLLGVLYYTAPLAFSMAGSKSTSNVFAAWVRMVGSQLFLMLCNVIFLRIFLVGFYMYESIVLELQDKYPSISSGLSMPLVWFLLMFGILHIGTRVDSYLATLGLGAAQTGRGMGAALITTALGVQRTLQAGARLGKGATHMAKSAAESAQTHSENHAYKTDSRTGAATEKTLVNAANGNLSKEGYAKMQGFAGGSAFATATQGLSQQELNRFDPNSFRIGKDGVISGAFAGAKPGEAPTQFQAVPISGKNSKNVDMTQHQGRIISVKDSASGDTVKYFATATGPDATGFYANTPAAKELEQNLSKQGYTISHPESGIITATKMDEKTGAITEAVQYASANIYKPDVAAGSTITKLNGEEFHVADITAATQGNIVADTDRAVLSNKSGAAIDALKSSFPALTNAPIQDVSPIEATYPNMANTGAIIYNSGDGGSHILAPTATCTVSQEYGNNIRTVTASNGATYADVFVQKADNIQQAIQPRADFQTNIQTGRAEYIPFISKSASAKNLYSQQTNDIGAVSRNKTKKK